MYEKPYMLRFGLSPISLFRVIICCHLSCFGFEKGGDAKVHAEYRREVMAPKVVLSEDSGRDEANAAAVMTKEK
jgi:hypothetical protein